VEAALSLGAPAAITPAHIQSVIVVENVSKSFGRAQALCDVSLKVNPGEIRCLLGENGAGKTTLCNLLFGIYKADQGNLLLRGREFVPLNPQAAIAAGVTMVHQHFSLIPTLSVLDNLMLGRGSGLLDRSAARRRITEVTNQLGISLDLDDKIENLSVSARQLTEIVKCLLSSPTLLVLDEPTAVLPVSEIKPFLATIQRIANSGCGVILVTHKLTEIAAVANTITVLRHGRVVAESINPNAEIDHLVSAMIGRPGNTNLKFSKKGKDTCNDAQPSSQRDALMLDGIYANDDQGSVKLANFTLIVQRGEIVGIAGVEGNGQTELARIISGLSHPVSGRVFLGDIDISHASPRKISSSGAAIIPEDRHAVGCILDLEVAENLRLGCLEDYTSTLGLLNRGRLYGDAAKLIADYDIRCESPSIAMRSLSGGNQQKVVLARELSRNGVRFVLAAHPTRGLDVGAVEAVYGHLRSAAAQGAGVLLITTELDELFAVADRIVVLYRGRIAGELKPESYNLAAVGALMSGQR